MLTAMTERRWTLAWLALAVGVATLVAGPLEAKRKTQADPVLAFVYGQSLVQSKVAALVAPDRAADQPSLRQAAEEEVDRLLALHGLAARVQADLERKVDVITIETQDRQGGFAAWTLQLAQLGQSPLGWKRALQCKLAINLQLPADATQIAEAAIVDRYTRRWSKVEVPAHVRVQEIAVPLASQATDEVQRARAVMISASERLARGEPFANVARVLSQTPDAAQGGDRGWLRLDLVDLPLAAALAAIKVGERTPIVHSAWGLHILLLHERRPQRKLSLDQVRDQISAQLSDENTYKQRRQWLQAARQRALAAGKLRWIHSK